ncbi:MAG: hypothetical protein AAF998_04800 [Bacteroidota bacterium]
MNTLRFYKVTTICLLVLNLGGVAFLLFLREVPGPLLHQMRGRQFRAEVNNLFGMDGPQREQFEQSARKHHQSMRRAVTAQRTQLRAYFEAATLNQDRATADSLLGEIQALERAKVQVTEAHFAQVRTLLRPDQEAAFAQFVNRALKIILLEDLPRPPKKPRK